MLSSSHIESGVQLFSRLRAEKANIIGINQHLFGQQAPVGNQVIEIAGDSNSRNRKIMLDLLIRCILPTDLNPEWKDSKAIVIITELQITPITIFKHVRMYLKSKNNRSRKRTLAALKNLIFLNCHDREQLELTLLNLCGIVQKNMVSLIVMDDIYAFYWNRPNSRRITMHKYAMQMLELIHKNINCMYVVFVYVRNRETKFVNQITDYQMLIHENGTIIVNNMITGKETKVRFKKNNVIQYYIQENN